MTSSALESIPSGEEIFLDAPVFIYHFTGVSASCRGLLERCERQDLVGVTSLIVLAEVAHRLMTIEAVEQGLVTPGNIVRKLRDKPGIVRQLIRYQDKVNAISNMGIVVLDLGVAQLQTALSLQRKHGLLTNDSLVAGAALDGGITHLATADRDFERLDELTVYRPTDLL